ncbi:MAG: histidine--tRNA ligase, partial [Clostridia bacterium]|nr:histidine--tRNA ligase [Clostridia bacterium]
AMREAGVADIERVRPRLYVAALGERAMVKALGIVERQRKEGNYAECDIVGRSLKAQMKYANKLGADYTLIIGDSEIDCGKAQLRNMQTGEQTEIELDSFKL